MPAPALVRVAAPVLIMPVIEPAPLFVIDSALPVVNAMAAALKVLEVIVKPVNAAVPPTAPVKVVPSVDVVERVRAPFTVELNEIAPPLVPVVKIALPLKVTGPV